MNLLLATLTGTLRFLEATCAGIFDSVRNLCCTLVRAALVVSVAFALTFAWDALSMVAMSDAVSCVVALAAVSIFYKKGLPAKAVTLLVYAVLLCLTVLAVRKPCAARHVWELRTIYEARGRNLLKTCLWLASTACSAASASVHSIAMRAQWTL